METKYLCPHCRTTLNIDDDIIITAEKKSGERGVVMLHTELGNYTSKKNSDFTVKAGEDVDFFCPICSKSLEYKFKISLASLIMIDVNDRESVIVFSKIYQKKCTHQIVDKEVYSYGECAKKFSNPEWFL